MDPLPRWISISARYCHCQRESCIFNRIVHCQLLQLLWEKRHYLTEEPAALTKVLQVAQSWDWASLSDLYGLLQRWKALKPLEALQLLLPCFPDIEVRRCAVEWLRPILSDELVDYLPQLVEALKLEPFDHSPLMVFLLERSLSSVPLLAPRPATTWTQSAEFRLHRSLFRRS